MKQLLLTDEEELIVRAALDCYRPKDEDEQDMVLNLLGTLSAAKRLAFIPKAEEVADEPPEKETTTPIIGADALLFSYNDVKKALCEACRLGVPESFSLDLDKNITHHLNGVRIPCNAHAWRGNRTIHAKTFPNELIP